MIAHFLLIGAALFGAAQAQNLDSDLDGDGKTDSAHLSITDNGWVLEINGTRFRGTPEAEPDRLKLEVIDLKKGDGHREVALHDPGPSDDDSWKIFGILGGKARYLGLLENWPTFHGDGTVTVRRFQDCWDSTDRFRYNPGRRKLVWIPRRTYPMSVLASNNERLPVMRRPGDPNGVVQLEPGTRIRLIAAVRKGALKGPPARGYQQFDYRIRWHREDKVRYGYIASDRLKDLDGLKWAD